MSAEDDPLDDDIDDEPPDGDVVDDALDAELIDEEVFVPAGAPSASASASYAEPPCAPVPPSNAKLDVTLEDAAPPVSCGVPLLAAVVVLVDEVLLLFGKAPDASMSLDTSLGPVPHAQVKE